MMQKYKVTCVNDKCGYRKFIKIIEVPEDVIDVEEFIKSKLIRFGLATLRAEKI